MNKMYLNEDMIRGIHGDEMYEVLNAVADKSVSEIQSMMNDLNPDIVDTDLDVFRVYNDVMTCKLFEQEAVIRDMPMLWYRVQDIRESYYIDPDFELEKQFKDRAYSMNRINDARLIELNDKGLSVESLQDAKEIESIGSDVLSQNDLSMLNYDLNRGLGHYINAVESNGYYNTEDIVNYFELYHVPQDLQVDLIGEQVKGFPPHNLDRYLDLTGGMGKEIINGQDLDEWLDNFILSDDDGMVM